MMSDEEMSDEEKVEQTMNRAVQKYREMWWKEKITAVIALLSTINDMTRWKELCDQNDKKACQILDEVVPELRRQVKYEHNKVAEYLLKDSGLWEEKSEE